MKEIIKSNENQSRYSVLVENGYNPIKFGVYPNIIDIYNYDIKYQELIEKFNLSDDEIRERYGTIPFIKRYLPKVKKCRVPATPTQATPTESTRSVKQKLSNSYLKRILKNFNISDKIEINSDVLKNILYELYDVQFTLNKFGEKRHEGLLMNIFIKHGLTPIESESSPSIFELIVNEENNLKTVESLKGQYFFIYQPFGTQRHPDFIICVDGFIVWVEAKSSSTKIMWNSNYPRKNVLYVYTHKKSNTTTLFFGHDHSIYSKSSNFEKKYEELTTELKKLSEDKFEDLFSESTDLSFYLRRMLNDRVKYQDEQMRKQFFDKVKDLLL